MNIAAAMTRDAPPGFSIGPLTTYADPSDMADWVEAAAAGHELVYATGPGLADHPAKRLALWWQEQGWVSLKQRRSARAHCFDYVAERRAVGQPPEVKNKPGDGARDQMAMLLRILRRCAERGKACPSNAALATELGLRRDPRGRRRAQYLFDRLAAEQRISVTGCGRNAPRVVTILAAGRGQGKSTKGETV